MNIVCLHNRMTSWLKWTKPEFWGGPFFKNKSIRALRSILCYAHLTCKIFHPFSIEIGFLSKRCVVVFCFCLFVCLFLSLLRCTISVRLNMTVPKSIVKFIAANWFNSKGQIYQKACSLLALSLEMELKNCTKGHLYSECFS